MSWWNLRPAPGIVLNLERDSVGVVLLGSEEGLAEGSVVKRTGRAADVPAGEAMIGRTLNALGEPIDGLGAIEAAARMPIEREASGVVSREPVNVPQDRYSGHRLHGSHRPRSARADHR